MSVNGTSAGVASSDLRVVSNKVMGMVGKTVIGLGMSWTALRTIAVVDPSETPGA